MTTTLTTSPGQVLDDEIIERCAARAAELRPREPFFTEDFEELRATGYLLMAVPTELGGLGITLAEVCRESAAWPAARPATALATNMHVYWTGLAADLYRAGDRSLVWLLEEAVAGEVFAAGSRRGRQRPAGADVDRRRPSRSTAATGSPATRSSAR